LASNLGTIIMLFAASGYFAFAYRYTFSFVFASLVMLLILVLKMLEDYYKNSINIYYGFIAIIIIGALIGQGYTDTVDKRKSILANLKTIFAGVKGNPPLALTNFQNEKIKYIKMQQSVPEGHIILARLSYPFLLDFNRNKIWTIDVPGGASLPPGLPLFQDDKMLIDYLKIKWIKYIAYSYKNECNHPWENKQLRDRLNIKAIPWLRLSTLATFDFQRKLIEISKKCNKIYDDGENFILEIP
jgi:hypothetical protein